MIETFDFKKLDDTSHMLEWLHDDAISEIREEFQANLNSQVEGSILLGFHVVSEPDWLTGAVPNEDDESKAIVARCGLAFAFSLSVKTPAGQVFNLEGVYTWVCVNMNDPQNIAQRTWMDLNGKMNEFGSSGALKERIYYSPE